MIDYPWYQIAQPEDGIMQGDMIFNLPIIIPPSKIDENDEIDTDVDYYDVIVMSQSCDIEQCKIQHILVCPIWNLDEFVKVYNNYDNDGGKENLRQGKVINYHMLNKCEIHGSETDYLIVDFKSILSVHLDFLSDFVKNNGKDRIRLMPPFREQMSQSFARSFMRVGLPSDIPKFK